jgi:hypothetical protein
VEGAAEGQEIAEWHRYDLEAPLREGFDRGGLMSLHHHAVLQDNTGGKLAHHLMTWIHPAGATVTYTPRISQTQQYARITHERRYVSCLFDRSEVIARTSLTISGWLRQNQNRRRRSAPARGQAHCDALRVVYAL